MMKSIRIFAAAALACAAAPGALAQSQSDISAKIESKLPDNGRGQITGGNIRDVFNAFNAARGKPNGIANLDENGRLPPSVTPSDLSPNKLTLPDTDQGSTGNISGMSALSAATGTVNRVLADKLFEQLSVNDFYKASDGNDYLPAFNRAIAAMPASGGTIRVPRRNGCYPVTGPIAIGDGSTSAASTKQNISIEGDGTGGTGNQLGYNTDKGSCIQYTGTTSIGAIMSFRGPMTMGLKRITLKSGFKEITNSTTISTTAGFNTITNISNTSNIVVGSNIFAPDVLPPGTIVISRTGNTAVISNNALVTASNSPVTFYHNEAYADRGLELLHVFRSKIEDVGVMDARVGIRQDVYADANVSIGSADNDFTNVWVENQRIAGGPNGTAAFDIGNADTGNGHRFDVARNTYTNLVGVVAGDPNATGLNLRYADNLTFRGGMMYSLNPPGLGYAMAILTPTGPGNEVIYPAEITISGVALIGRIYRDPRWKPASNGGFGFAVWPLHTGDMLNRNIQGHGSLPSFDGFTGVDDRGIFFGWSQWRSWLDDAAGISVAYDAPATLSRKMTLTQVTGTTAATAYATHQLPANAMRARNSKDYPNGTFPLSDAAQYSFDRMVALSQSGSWSNGNAATSIRVQVKLGGAIIFDSGLRGINAASGFGHWTLEGKLTQTGSATQTFSGRLTLGPAGTATGVSETPIIDVVGGLASAVDMSSDKELKVEITPSAAGFVWNAERSMATVH
ncbi:UNVERIFIED_CONTAM: hypothetical protein Q9R58_27385 [Methylobacteriaceae bacterium AG10]|nr:hypothetical protein [Methylobacteriaceae bacterium AG10]